MLTCCVNPPPLELAMADMKGSNKASKQLKSQLVRMTAWPDAPSRVGDCMADCFKAAFSSGVERHRGLPMPLAGCRDRWLSEVARRRDARIRKSRETHGRVMLAAELHSSRAGLFLKRKRKHWPMGGFLPPIIPGHQDEIQSNVPSVSNGCTQATWPTSRSVDPASCYGDVQYLGR